MLRTFPAPHFWPSLLMTTSQCCGRGLPERTWSIFSFHFPVSVVPELDGWFGEQMHESMDKFQSSNTRYCWTLAFPCHTVGLCLPTQDSVHHLGPLASGQAHTVSHSHRWSKKPTVAAVALWIQSVLHHPVPVPPWTRLNWRRWEMSAFRKLLVLLVVFTFCVCELYVFMRNWWDISIHMCSVLVSQDIPCVCPLRPQSFHSELLVLIAFYEKCGTSVGMSVILLWTEQESPHRLCGLLYYQRRMKMWT